MPRSRSSLKNLPNIPQAPVVQFYHAAAKHFEDEKHRLGSKLPLLETEEIIRHRSPYIVVFQNLLSTGYQHVVDEILELKELEQVEVQNCRRSYNILLRDTQLLAKLANVLKESRRHEIRKNYLSSAYERYQLALDFLHDDDIWLALHFLETSLSRAEKVRNEESHEFKAKLHCLLAHLGQQYYPRLDDRLACAVEHLESALVLSKKQAWMYHNKFITVSLRTPIAIYGLREESKEEPSSNNRVYKLATLIYFNVLMGMADLRSLGPETSDKIGAALKLAEEALLLAKEARKPIAVMSALTLCGMLLRKVRRFSSAQAYFDKLLYEAEFAQDFETRALALANIGHCYQGRRQPAEALNWFENEYSVAVENRLPELLADSFEHIGHILLQEGVLAEAELSLREAYIVYHVGLRDKGSRNNRNSQAHKAMRDSTWALTAVSAGHNMWGRFAGLCRQSPDEDDALDALMEWKDRRNNLISVPSPSNRYIFAEDVVGTLEDRWMPKVEECDERCLKEQASSLLNLINQSGNLKIPKAHFHDTCCTLWGEVEKSGLGGNRISKVTYASEKAPDGEDEEDEEVVGKSSLSVGGSHRASRTKRVSRVLSFARDKSSNQDDILLEDGVIIGSVPSKSTKLFRQSVLSIPNLRKSAIDEFPEELTQLRNYRDSVEGE